MVVTYDLMLTSVFEARCVNSLFWHYFSLLLFSIYAQQGTKKSPNLAGKLIRLYGNKINFPSFFFFLALIFLGIYEVCVL